ncbi:hypothetical protein HNR47_000971 [Methylopila jiangsuensis]|uniref:hypothetical protein n=1 Tax=Methylopila jiangsuensis TaxID=586230 RepID=UPI0022F2F625|nr:hypothetical protein [Methylopila jiangsuensis]MDR6284988.1 hypothetical protein [Methylopila jiangsuensis]
MDLSEAIARPIPHYDGKRSFLERLKRRQRDLDRLKLETQAVVRALPQYEFRECEFESQAEHLKSFIGTAELIPVPVRGPKGSMVVIVAPTRVWHDAKIRERLWRLRRSSLVDGVPTVRLLTQRWIRRKPFLENCELIARCAQLSVSARDRFSVQLLVRENPLATLEDCAAVVQATDAFGVVFALVSSGLLTIDFEAAITPMSPVEECKRER